VTFSFETDIFYDNTGKSSIIIKWRRSALWIEGAWGRDCWGLTCLFPGTPGMWSVLQFLSPHCFGYVPSFTCGSRHAELPKVIHPTCVDTGVSVFFRH